MTGMLNQSVLLLNRNYAALHVIDVRRSIVMLIRGVAEAIDFERKSFYNYDFRSWRDLSAFRAEFEAGSSRWLRCVGQDLLVPTVIRLLEYNKVRRRGVPLNRRNVFARDANTCQYCGKRFKTSDLNLDHVVPKSRGGGTRWDNLVCSCIRCNTRKANRTPEEAGMKLIRQPKAPPGESSLIRVRHDSWKHFVEDAYWNVELED